MSSALQLLTVLLPCGYLLSALLHGMAFGGDRAPRVGGLRRGVLRATLLVHLGLFVLRAYALSDFPVNDTWSVISAVALSTAVTYALLALRAGHPGTGGVVLGLVFLLQLLASGLGNITPTPRPAGMSVFRVLHIATSVFSGAALILSGVHGFLYIVLLRVMRKRRFGALFEHLPDLELLARMTRGAALAGFLGLTIGLNVGIALAHTEKLASFDYRAPEVLLSLLLWVHFGVVAFSGSIRGFSARRASIAAACGLIALLLSLLLILFPGHVFHSTL